MLATLLFTAALLVGTVGTAPRLPTYAQTVDQRGVGTAPRIPTYTPAPRIAAYAQTPDQKSPTKVEPLTLTGCVSPKAEAGNYTFTDSTGGSQYRLTGKDIKKYAGKKVEVVEAASKGGLTVKGGLYPSPNVAGQACALDPVQSAIATLRGSGNATGASADLPEFRANRVRLVDGQCQ